MLRGGPCALRLPRPGAAEPAAGRRAARARAAGALRALGEQRRAAGRHADRSTGRIAALRRRRCAGRRRGPGRRHAAPGHAQPLGQQGQRHRTQLRFCHRACRALHRVHAAAGQAPAGLGPAADRRRMAGLRGAAARPHDRVGAQSARRRPPAVLPQGRRRVGACRCAGRGQGGARARQPRLGAGAVGRRDRLPGRRLRQQAAPQSQRRRADDVRAGQQRALPAQDLQRPLRRRRPGADAVAVRHDPQHRAPGTAAHRGGLRRQRRHHGRPRHPALAAGRRRRLRSCDPSRPRC
jgi:hypothetical protein